MKSRTYRDTFELETHEFKCSEVQEIDESFSFGLFFNSTEERAMEYRNLLADKSIEYSLLVDFKAPDENPEEVELKRQNFMLNKEHLLSRSSQFKELVLDNIFDYQENLNTIVSSIPRKLFTTDAKFFIDISGTPLIYTVALLRFFKLSFPSPVLYLLNVSGDYDNQEKGQPQFTRGVRENIFIPGYFGDANHASPYLYIFLLGYEGERSYNIFRENDPYLLEVFIPNPGYEEGNHLRTIRYNKDFLKETEYIVELCNESDDGTNSFKYAETKGKSMFHIPVEDIGCVCDTILKIFEDNKNEARIRLVPLGPKPHAIGAGLAGLIEDKISIMYQAPIAYSMNKVKAGEKMWVHKIKSL